MERNIERILREARYVLENKCTVREGAKKFGVSKSTFHADVTYKLKDVDKETYEKVPYGLSLFNPPFKGRRSDEKKV